jgi:hypothetical protein
MRRHLLDDAAAGVAYQETLSSRCVWIYRKSTLKAHRAAVSPARTSLPILTALTLIMLTLICGCGESFATQRKTINDRDYTLTVTHAGNRLLEATCTYVGKRPKDAELFRNQFRHDYETNDTDFYTTTLTNLSDRTMTIRRVDYAMKYGAYRGKSTFDAAAFAKTWTSAEIPPGGQISRHTHFVWAARSSNSLSKTITIQTERQNATPLEFSVTLPFLYRR